MHSTVHGHVRDVPNKEDAVSPEFDFAIDWRILPQAVPHFRVIALAAFRSQGVVLATDADREGEAIVWHVYQLLKGAAAGDREGEAIAWHVYQLLKGAAAARRRAEVQQREKEQRREKMVQQAVLIEEQLAAEAQEAAEEEGAVLQGAEGWEGESDLFSNGAAAANSSLISPEAEELGSLDGSASANVAAADGAVGGVGESRGEGLKQQGGQHGWLEGEELLGEWLLPAAGSNGCDLTIHRATFHEITPSAVLSALSHPRLLSQPLVDAYFARRVLDFLMGFNLSPVLWRKLPGCKSAGRVQSVALRFVCEREGEVAGFNTQEYWTVSAMVQACRTTKGALLESSKGLLERKLAGRGREVGEGGEGGAVGAVGAVGAGVGSDAPLSFPARLTHLFGEPVGAGAGGGGGGGGAGGGRRAKEGKEAKEAKEEKQGKEGDENSVAAAAAAEVEGGIRDGERALAAAVLVEGSELQVQGVHRSQTRRSPSPPFTTSSMQQEASSKLGFSPSRTMAVSVWWVACYYRVDHFSCPGLFLRSERGGGGWIRDGERALAAAVLVEGSELQVQGVHRSQTRRSPSPPFTTSSMQQKASSKLGFSPSRTMAAVSSLDAAAAVLVEGIELQVQGLNRSQTRRSPSPPFTTSSLQQEASSKLGFSPSRTMAVAQRLYEGVALGPEASRVLQGEGAGGTKGAGRKGAGGGGGMVTGLITYMRTDSVQKLRGLAGGGGVVTGLITYMCTDSVQLRRGQSIGCFSQAAVATLRSLLQQKYGCSSYPHLPTSLPLPFPLCYPFPLYQVSQTAVASLRSLLQQKYGSKLVSPSPRVFASKARNAQEAHEAIRPTHPHLLPALVKPDLSEEQWKLYALVWARFAASQMANAVYDRVAVDIAAYPLDPSLLSAFPSQDPSASESPSLDPAAPSTSPPAVLRANAFAIAWPGFLAAYSDSRTLGYLSDLSEGITTEPPPGDATSAEADSTATTSDVFQEIMALQPGDRLSVESVDPSQHFTRPPPRYTEAALIKKMEAEGIGRPSTYAPTLKTLLERKYVELDARRLHPTIRGRLANAFLLHFMEPYVNAAFTAQLESKFDDVAAGEEDWRQVLRTFWTDFQPRVDEMHKLSPQAVGSAVQVTLGDGLLVEAAQTYSEVLAKARAPALPASSSSSTSSLPSESSEPSEPSALSEKHLSSSPSALSTPSHSKTCPSCGSGELEYNFSSRGVGLFVGCSAYPACHFKARVVEQEGKAGTLAVAIDPVAHIIGEDPSTGAKIWLKVGPYGAYVERSSYGKVSKVNRASLAPGTHPDSVDLPKALELLAFPRTVGPHPEGGTVLLCNGPFGFYVEHDYPGIGLIRASLGTNVSIDDVTLESAIERLQVKQARAERAAAKKAAKAAKTGKGSKAGAAETSTEAGKGSGKEAGKAAKAAKEGKGSKSGAAETSTEAGKGAEKEATKEASKRASKEAGKKASKSAGTDEKGEPLQQEEVEGEGMGVGGAGKGGKAVRVKKGKEEEEEEEGRGETGQEFTRGTSQKEQQSKERRGTRGGMEVARRNRLPRRPSDQLKEIIGKEHEQLSIFEATKLVWDYVKAHNLKTGSHTAAFDDKLRALFGVDEANSSKVPGLLLPHMQEVAEAGKEASEMGKEASEMGKEAAQVRKEAFEVGKEVAQAEEEAGKEGKAVRPLKSFETSPKKTDLEAGEEPGKEARAAEHLRSNEASLGLCESTQPQDRPAPLPVLFASLPRFPQHEQLSIFEATKVVWDYVKAHNLKTGSHTAAFDDKLRALFGVDEANSSRMLGLLLPHMQEVAEAGEEVSQVVKEDSEVGREAAQVGREASKVGQEASKVEIEAFTVGKEASKVGTEAGQVGKQASKVGNRIKDGRSIGAAELIRLKQLPRRPSEQLKEIIGKEHEQLSILEATSLVWNYVKANNLQASPNTAAFDDKLRALFGGGSITLTVAGQQVWQRTKEQVWQRTKEQGEKVNNLLLLW
ncbi:unnamed protein product [Closterium sp. Naga37s-1]|nr:unnamed protein product [Closterium sp. Naga37s-1]